MKRLPTPLTRILPTDRLAKEISSQLESINYKTKITDCFWW